jgi:hypothetical protein
MEDSEFVVLLRPGMHIDELLLTMAAAGVDVECEDFCRYKINRTGNHRHYQISVGRDGEVSYSAFCIAGWHCDPKTVVKLLHREG